MKNRAQLATFASVPFVLLALLACKGFSKSEPKPSASATAAVTTTTPTAAPTPDDTSTATADPGASAKPMATFGSSTAAVKPTTATSAKTAPSASTAAAAKDAGVAAAKDAGVAAAKDAGATSTAATTFKVGDKVQVHWKSSWYPAAVIAVPSPGQYKIHYDGYEASWDETVGNDRIKAR